MASFLFGLLSSGASYKHVVDHARFFPCGIISAVNYLVGDSL